MNAISHSFAARCGLLTASEMKLIVTPTMKVANNDKTRSHRRELCRREALSRRDAAQMGFLSFLAGVALFVAVSS